MDCRKLIEQGDKCFEKGDYTKAFSVFKEGMERGDAYCTFMMAECYRIAFHQHNLVDIDKVNEPEYASNAIELYAKAYLSEKNPVYLVREFFVRYILDRPEKSSPYYKEMMGILSRFAGEESLMKDTAFKFLLAVNADDDTALFDIVIDSKHEKYYRIAACVEIYKKCSSSCDRMRASMVLVTANNIGAQFQKKNEIREWEPNKRSETWVSLSRGKTFIDDAAYTKFLSEDAYGSENLQYEYYQTSEFASTYSTGEYRECDIGDSYATSSHLYGGSENDYDGTSYEEDCYPSDDGPDDLYDYYYNDDYDGWDYDDY